MLLFGNLLNVLIATLVGTLIINLVGRGSVTSVIIATAISTIIVVTFGELTPKSISTRVADKWSLLVINIIRGLMFISTPAVWTFAMIPKLITRTFLKSTIEENPMVTTGELRKLIDLGEEEGTVDVTQGEMLENVFRFGEMQIKDIMTPRPEIIWVDKNISISSFLKIYKIFQSFPKHPPNLPKAPKQSPNTPKTTPKESPRVSQTIKKRKKFEEGVFQNLKTNLSGDLNLFTKYIWRPPRP